MRTQYLPFFLIFILISGCSLQMKPDRVQGKAASAVLANSSWRLKEFQSMSDRVGTVIPTDPSQYTMELGEDGQVSMKLNCNRAMGSWSAQASSSGQGGNFRFGELAGTRALCPPPSMDERILADAQYVRSFVLKDGNLYLSLMADGGIYTWEPLSDGSSKSDMALSPEEGGPRNFEVKAQGAALKAEKSDSSETLTQYKPGTLLDNLGCTSLGESSWCDVQQLGGGPRGYVNFAQIQPATSPDGSVAMGSDDSALRAGQGDFDARSIIPCAEKKGQPMTQCALGVARAGGGYATVVVTLPSGKKRIIFFRMGRAMSADFAEADPWTGFEAKKEADLNLIRVGNERYEIPDAVVLGG